MLNAATLFNKNNLILSWMDSKSLDHIGELSPKVNLVFHFACLGDCFEWEKWARECNVLPVHQDPLAFNGEHLSLDQQDMKRRSFGAACKDTINTNKVGFRIFPGFRNLDSETFSLDSATLSLDSETFSLDSETLSLYSETFSLDSETLSSETFWADSETLFVGFRNFFRWLTFSLDSETFFVGFRNFFRWIQKLFSLDSETFSLDSETFFVGFRNFFRWIQNFFSSDSETIP